MKNILKSAALCALFVAGEVFSSAQSYGPAAMERNEMESLWLGHTNNAAGALIDVPKNMSSADFSYNLAKGDFKRAQEGNDNSSLGFYTQGGGIFDKMGGAYVWGEFKYSNEQIAGARWNASLIDPLRDMPFFLADERASKWKNQHYDMTFKMASPVMMDHLVVGVTGKYNVAQGAKQLDPRPLTEMAQAQVMPAVVWKFNDSHSLGADFLYSLYREAGSASNINGIVDTYVYDISAPGFFNGAVLGSFGSPLSRIKSYTANTLGGGIHYSFTSDRLSVLAGGNYAYKVEEAKNDYLNRMAGTVRDTRYDLGVSAVWTLGCGDKLFFDYRHSVKDIDGIEYFQTYDNTYEVQTWVTDAKFVRSNFRTVDERAEFDYMICDDKGGYKYKFFAELGYTDDSYVYYVPLSERSIRTADFKLGFAYNFSLGEAHSLLVNAYGGTKWCLGRSFDYNGTHADDVCFKEFVMADYNYLSANSAVNGADVTYTYSGLKGGRSVFAKASYARYDSDSGVLGNRRFAVVKVGLIF